MKKAIVLLSGGIDSATCCAIAKQQGFNCYGLSFNYGQRHAAELDAAKRVAEQIPCIDHRVIRLDIGEMGGSALTDNSLAVPEYAAQETIPITYVPARNTVFLSVALGYAEIIGACDIFCGICSIDYSNYPDCRQEYLAAFTKLANLATKSSVNGSTLQFHAPLLYLTKAETIQLGNQLGLDYSQTISCYQATPTGLACGTCDSCVLRRKGFEQALVADPTHYI